MCKASKYYVIAAIVVVACLGIGLFFYYEPVHPINDLLAAYKKTTKYSELTITYPLDGTLFPPEIVSPTFCWKDNHSEVNNWLVTLQFEDEGKTPLSVITKTPEWKPSDKQWETIKQRSLEKKAKLIVIGIKESFPNKILSANSISISTSKDEVGDSVFYREVILPFKDAIVDPSEIQWRFGAISSKTQPPVVLEELPVCGNCHSFSADGSMLAMDIDYANDKGSYAIAPVEEEITLDKSKVITWGDYKKEDGEFTFGLLSQISPDGKYVVSTVKDRSVFVATKGLLFSQLFFPIKGILVTYNRDTQMFQELIGATDPEFVQSNPSWSPDGKHIVFARNKAYKLKHFRDKDTKGALLTEEEAREFTKEGKTFLYDLYRIPFNDGKGGKPEPLKGASNNGMSNYFAKYSPDGKWIVFCKAKSFMLLQPDSELYIVPAEGGKARKMRCNTNRMNSWHSWSSNSKWLIFSSKVNTPYTQLFLTHIDEDGNDTPPVLLEQFTSPDRAANIPEFVKLKPGAIKKIREKFVDDVSLVRAAQELMKAKNYKGAVPILKNALEINPNNADANASLGLVFASMGKQDKALEYGNKALALDPTREDVYNQLGIVLANQGKHAEATKYFKEALRLKPDFTSAHNNIAIIFLEQGNFQEATFHYKEIISSDPKTAYFNLGTVMFRQGKHQKTVEYLKKLLEIDPDSEAAYNNLALALHKMGRFKEAAKYLREVLRLNPYSAGVHSDLAVILEQMGEHQEAAFHREKAKMLNK